MACGSVRKNYKTLEKCSNLEVFVGNLPSGFTEGQVNNLIRVYHDARIRRVVQSNDQTFCFLTCETSDTAAHIINSFNQKVVFGKKLRAELRRSINRNECLEESNFISSSYPSDNTRATGNSDLLLETQEKKGLYNKEHSHFPYGVSSHNQIPENNVEQNFNKNKAKELSSAINEPYHFKPTESTCFIHGSVPLINNIVTAGNVLQNKPNIARGRAVVLEKSKFLQARGNTVQPAIKQLFDPNENIAICNSKERKKASCDVQISKASTLPQKNKMQLEDPKNSPNQSVSTKTSNSYSCIFPPCQRVTNNNSGTNEINFHQCSQEKTRGLYSNVNETSIIKPPERKDIDMKTNILKSSTNDCNYIKEYSPRSTSRETKQFGEKNHYSNIKSEKYSYYNNTNSTKSAAVNFQEELMPHDSTINARFHKSYVDPSNEEYDDIEHGRLLKVCNFPYRTTEEELFLLFQEFEPLSVWIETTTYDKPVCTVAYISFPNDALALNAVMNFDNTAYDGRTLLVSFTDDDDLTSEMILLNI